MPNETWTGTSAPEPRKRESESQMPNETWTGTAPRLLLALVALAVALPCVAAEPAPSDDERPRVGLVLSGGGARGAAHVGVLEVLEELQIPVDYIVGTSMGAVIGGMYASGLSPEEIRESLLEVDWEDAFRDLPDRRYIPFRQKEDDRLPLFNLELGFGGDGLTAPSGLVSGQKLNFILRSLTLHVAGVRTFDNLPIPFRAVAVDLNTGKVVVLDHGDLAKAIRASMAYPVMFTPVVEGEKRLVDGGVLSNLPIDVGLGMGADHLIAVDVSTPLEPLERTPSLFGMVGRTMAIMGDQDRPRQIELLREQDTLIRPDLEGIDTFGGFSELGPAMDAGLEATREHADDLRSLSVSAAEFQRFKERQRHDPAAGQITIRDVEVTGAKRVSPKLIARRIETETGDAVDLEAIQKDLLRVYQIGDFEYVDFRLHPEDGGYRLVVQVKEKPWGPWYLRPGLALASELEGSARLAITGLVRRPQINRLGAEWKTFVSVGDVSMFDSEFYQPLEYSGTWFVAPRAVLVSVDEDRVTFEDEEVLVDHRQGYGALDVGVQFRNFAELRAGARRGKIRGRQISGESDVATVNTGGWEARFTFDQLDNMSFPHQGTFAVIDYYGSRQGLGAEVRYDRVHFAALQAWPLAKRHTLIGSLGFGADLGSSIPFYDDFVLGGFLHLSGLRHDQIRGTRFALGRGIYLWEVTKLSGLFGGRLFAGASFEAGNAWPEDVPASSGDLRLAGSLFGGLESAIGPIYVGWGISEGGHDNLYMFIGRVFGARRRFP